MADSQPLIPPELTARLAHPTVRLSGPIDGAAAAAFLDQILPVLDVPGSIVVELFSSGGDADIGCRLAQEVRLLRELHGRDMWFLGKNAGGFRGSNLYGRLCAGPTVADPRYHPPDSRTPNNERDPPRGTIGKLSARIGGTHCRHRQRIAHRGRRLCRTDRRQHRESGGDTPPVLRRMVSNRPAGARTGPYCRDNLRGRSVSGPHSEDFSGTIAANIRDRFWTHIFTRIVACLPLGVGDDGASGTLA